MAITIEILMALQMLLHSCSWRGVEAICNEAGRTGLDRVILTQKATKWIQEFSDRQRRGLMIKSPIMAR